VITTQPAADRSPIFNRKDAISFADTARSQTNKISEKAAMKK